MIYSRSARLVMVVMLVGLMAATAMAQDDGTLTQTFSFEHRVWFNITGKQLVWAHTISLPDSWASKNVFFARRAIAIQTPLLKDERVDVSFEELTRNAYRVTFLYTAPKVAFVKRNIKIDVGMSGNSKPVVLPEPPSGLKIETDGPVLSWSGSGKAFCVTMLCKDDGATVFETCVPNTTKFAFDSNLVKAFSSYIWAVRQTDGSGWYSPEVRAAFSVEKVSVGSCDYCHGTGFCKCDSCSGTGRVKGTCHCGSCSGTGIVPGSAQRCTWCNGTGVAGSGPLNCGVCGGVGSMPGVKCSNCLGTGFVSYEENCSTCLGSGRAPCAVCEGSGQKFQIQYISEPVPTR